MLNLSNTKKTPNHELVVSAYFAVTIYWCVITVKISTTQAANISTTQAVGNAMQRNVAGRSYFYPWKGNTRESWLQQCYSQYKKGGVSSIQKKKNIIFLSSNHLEKKPQVGILNAYMSQKGQKPISDLLKTPSWFFEVWFFFS